MWFFLSIYFLGNFYRLEHSVSKVKAMKSSPPPWTIWWFRILAIFSDENIARLGVFMFQTSDNSLLCIDSLCSNHLSS